MKNERRRKQIKSYGEGEDLSKILTSKPPQPQPPPPLKIKKQKGKGKFDYACYLSTGLYLHVFNHYIRNT